MNNEDISKMIAEWATLPDDLLSQKIAETILGTGWTSSDAHWTFAMKIYPLISDQELRRKINKILPGLALNAFKNEQLEVSGRVVYVCAKLKLPNTKETILKLIEAVGNPTDYQYPVYLNWLNQALQELPIQEAEKFLIKQLEALPETWFEFVNNPQNSQHPDFRRYWAFARAHVALELINQSLATDYGKRLGLFRSKPKLG